MADGTWGYESNHEKPAFQICIPLADGNTVSIDHLSVNSSSKTFGSMTCLSGSSKGTFNQIQEKGQGWIDQVIAGKLNRWHIWFLLDRQFYPMVFYGISSITALFDALGKCLQQKW